MGQPMGELRFCSMMAEAAQKKREKRKKEPEDLVTLEEGKFAVHGKTGPLSEEQMQTSLRTLSKRAYRAIQKATGLESPTIIDLKKLIDSDLSLYPIFVTRGAGPKIMQEIKDFAYLHGLCTPPATDFGEMNGRERTFLMSSLDKFNVYCKDDLARFIRKHPDWEEIFSNSIGCGPYRLGIIKKYVAEHITAQDLETAS